MTSIFDDQATPATHHSPLLIDNICRQGSQAGTRIFNIFLNDLFYFLEGLCQTTNYDDDNSLASIDHNINVIKKDLELASEVAIQ